MGVKTRIAFISNLTGRGHDVENYPFPGNFHATTLEWAGVLRAVLEAREKIVACELGAGWGPWLVTVARAAKWRGIDKVHLVGVEASAHHCAYTESHFTDNGLDPKQHTVLRGIVAPRDGFAEFPVLENPARDWGVAAVNLHRSPAARVVRRFLRPLRSVLHYLRHRQSRVSQMERLRSYSLPTLLQPFARVNLIHVDIQGHEYEVLRRSSKSAPARYRHSQSPD